MGLTGTPPALPTVVTGSGEPVTLGAHGLGASVPETRPLLSGVPGTRVFYEARGHGGAPLADEPVTHEALAADLEAVSDSHGATRALGVSMGSGALLSLLARRPARFSRVVLVLPALLDEPRDDEALTRLESLADALDADDPAAVRSWCLADVPADLRDAVAVQRWLDERVAHMLASAGLARVVRELPRSVPVADRALLGGVRAEVLVVAQEGDPLHPASVARQVAAALPRAQLLVLDEPGALLRHRARLRAEISVFLAG